MIIMALDSGKTRTSAVAIDEGFNVLCRAEGVPVGVSYGPPLYRQPAFKRENLAKSVPRYILERMPNYEELNLPGAEEFARRELVLPHYLLLAPREALELVVAAIEKIKEHADELQPLVGKLKVSDTTIDATYHRM